MTTARDHAGDCQRTRSCATELVCRKCEVRTPTGRRRGVLSAVRQESRRRLRLRARHPAHPRDADAGAPAEHLVPGGAAADPRRRRHGASRRVRGLHAADQGRPAGRRGGPAQPVPQGRHHLPPEPLLQGPRGEHGGGAPFGARPQARSGASRPATSAPPWRRWRRRRGWRHTCSTPTAWSPPRRTPAARSARRCARWRATTTKPTKRAARSRKRPAWSSRTSRCAPSTPRGPRRRRTRSCSSSGGRRPTTSSLRPPEARSPHASTRACRSSRRWASRRLPTRRSTSPSPRAATRSPRRSSPAPRRSTPSNRPRRPTRWGSARPATGCS